MTTIATAQDRRSLDAAVWRTTGLGAAALPAVLLANPGIAEIATALPEGAAIVIPDLAVTIATIDLVQLWD